MIELAQPDLGGNEAAYVADCMASGWISSHGEYLGRFEQAFRVIAGTEHAVTANNGTTALHLALVALGVGPGDEVIVPTATYIATANAVTYCGATVVLVDVEPGTLNIDVSAARAAITARTKGIIAVHLYGIPARVADLRTLSDEHGIFLLEDAAEAHGARVDGKPVGSFGDAAVFSFFGNKIITTGEGGMVTTNDAELAAKVRLYRGQGMDSARRYWFPVVGYNYRMTNIQAAIGLAQTERFDAMLATRDALAAEYRRRLAPLADVLELPPVSPGVETVAWLFNVYLRNVDAAARDSTMARLLAAGVDSRPVFYPMHVLPPYASAERFPVADAWCARGISLPLHTGMTLDDVATVCAALAEAVVAA